MIEMYGRLESYLSLTSYRNLNSTVTDKIIKWIIVFILTVNVKKYSLSSERSFTIIYITTLNGLLIVLHSSRA